MKKASALTAALSGKRSEAVTPADDSARHTDSFSFPCLDHGDANNIDDITRELGKASLKSQSIAGSAPTAVLLPNGSIAVSRLLQRILCLSKSLQSAAIALRTIDIDTPLLVLMRVTLSLNNKNLPFDNVQADYELNPYRRRGGEERAPNPAASVVSYFAYYWTSCFHFHLRQYFGSISCRRTGYDGHRLVLQACRVTSWQMLSLAAYHRASVLMKERKFLLAHRYPQLSICCHPCLWYVLVLNGQKQRS